MSDKNIIAAPGDQLFGEHRDTEEIRKEIHAAASDVAQTLDALQAKLTPDMLLEEAQQAALSKADEIKDYVIEKAKAYPNVTMLLGLGTLWVVGRNLFGQGRGSGVVSLALGAGIGVVVYKTLNGTLVPAASKKREPLLLEAHEKDVSLSPALPLHATVD